MPDGSTTYGFDLPDDVAPAESPVQVTGLPITFGETLTFGATGSVNNSDSPSGLTPDGDYTNPPQMYGYFWHTAGAENGISDVRVPMNSLIGVFLTNAQPNLSPAPSYLDFDIGSATNNVAGGIGYTSLTPEIAQVFFIGDGLTGQGSGVQQTISVPAGATRLFLGTMDGYYWGDNYGSFSVTVTAIPEPSTFALICVGGANLLGYVWRRRGMKTGFH